MGTIMKKEFHRELSWNVTSIMTHKSIIQQTLHKLEVDIVLIQETFLKSHNWFKLPNSTLYKSDLLHYTRGGINSKKQIQPIWRPLAYMSACVQTPFLWSGSHLLAEFNAKHFIRVNHCTILKRAHQTRYFTKHYRFKSILQKNPETYEQTDKKYKTAS